jgi:hypothetical protein
VNLAKLVQNARMDESEVVELLKIANGYLPRVRLEYGRINEEMNSTKAELYSWKAAVNNEVRVYPVSGYWVGVLNMNETRSYIHHLNLTSQNHRVVVVDHNGTAIIDSLQNETPKREVNILNGNSPSNETKLIDLQSIKRALNGETGSIVENVNGTRTIVSYHPIEAYPHKWAAIVMEFDRDKP